jgi:hypothetical protein
MQRTRRFFAVAMVQMLVALLPLAAHASEGYFYQGLSGFSASFYLIGGQYQLYVNARLPTSPFNTNPRPCTFGSVFGRVSPDPEATTLGPGAAITTGVQYAIKPTLTLPAGLYQVKIVTLTTCSWNFDLISTTPNKAGLAPPQMRRETGHSMEMADTVSMGDTVEFFAPFRSINSQQTNVTGTLEIINGGQVIESLPLRGDGVVGRCNVFYVDLRWEPRDAKYLGKNIAKMSVKIGQEEFTTSAEFTLTQ